MDIYKNTNYIIDVPLVIDTLITEYDISKANISMLYAYEVISEDDYNHLYKLDKKNREIAIGRRIAEENADRNNPMGPEEVNEMVKTYSVISKGIVEAKRRLFQDNNIEQDDIVRIANDAVYIKNKVLNITNFDLNGNGRYITFATKGQYNIMVNLNRVTIFILNNPMSEQLHVDVKGISDNILYLHEPFIQFITELCNSVMYSGKETALRLFNNFYSQYVNRTLPVEFYREFNSLSQYKLLNLNYTVEWINEKDIDKIDINYNLHLLRTLYSAIINL